MLWQMLLALGRFIFRKEKASVAIEGLDKFAKRVERRLEKTEERLDECDEDRTELRLLVGQLGLKAEDCDEDRKDLRARLETLENHTGLPPE